MSRPAPRRLLLPAFLALPAFAASPDHHEFEATLHAPYQGDGRHGARTFTLDFDYPGARPGTVAHWQLALSRPGGKVIRSWKGRARLDGRRVTVRLHWRGRADAPLPAGAYKVRMRAAAGTGAHAGNDDPVEQEWEIALGPVPAVRMPAFVPMAAPSLRPPQGAAPAAGALPYTVYYGNLHSQTNHSDGGAELGRCSGAQEPQSAPYGPEDAFAFARGHGLDFLMASEHNHMYDGADGYDPAADPEQARALYQSGRTAAGAFSAANPGFVALYGMEWGVIGNGGHVNVIGAGELLGWERDGSGALLADTYTPKNDYAALYALMRQRGWLGQFNHPSWSGQFQVDGAAFGYTEDGGEAMALCEVLNTSAFSNSTTESETRRPNFEAACNRILEAGFRVAFSSNQDNHCANWGASYGNRTGILLQAGVAPGAQALQEAIRARRVFATMDKGSQVVLTANGRMMGERFDNAGALHLMVGFANAAGKRAASVVLFEGIPGRKGAVSELARSAEARFTPGPGEHFYYAKVTQEDGNVLWSAPVWVRQLPSMAQLR